jgi:CubicO group peptidase (beta-lactamase class C family)
MKSYYYSRILRFGVLLLGLVAVAMLLPGQEYSSSIPKVSMPEDWSHHHVVFSNSSTLEQNLRRDPRFWHQWYRRNVSRSAPSPRPAHDAFLRHDDNSSEPGSNSFLRSRRRHRRRPRLPEELKSDWAISLGPNGSVGAGNYPAKFSFDVNTANCGSAAQPDFVVFNTSVQGSSNQARIVAYDNLYTGCGGTVPTTYWALAHDVPTQKVDQIFARYAKPGSPGCSVGVIRDGDFVYRKAYGLANLELGVPLSAQSVFYMGSVSKQFTAASVVLAAEQGYLSLDDDVRKYIPELPDYGRVITVRQMIHQTSGFRDFYTLLDLSGQDPVVFDSPKDIFKIVVRQRGLNNVPGEEWIYSNTNYFLLGMVVQRATKKSLAEFAAENIFKPLGMSHTLFYDDHTVVVPGRVAAYDPAPQDSFRVDWSTTFEVVGAGGLMSSIDDLLLWDKNFLSNRLGKGTLVQELQTPGALNNGNKISYAMGLDLGNYRGLPISEHGGGLFGYRTELLRFPEQKFSVICLCNVANAEPENLARQVADIYLADRLQPGASALNPSGKGDFPDPATFAGKYLDPRTHLMYTFTASDGNLMAWGARLRRINANQFYDLGSNVITFESSKGTMYAKLDLKGETYFSGSRIQELDLGKPELASYTGQFRSTELDAVYGLSLEKDTLTLRNGDNPPQNLSPIAKDEFDAGDFGRLVFERNSSGRVFGFRVFTQGARGIAFRKED